MDTHQDIADAQGYERAKEECASLREIDAAEINRLKARSQKLESALRGVIDRWREFGEMMDERVEDAAKLIEGVATPIA